MFSGRTIDVLAPLQLPALVHRHRTIVLSTKGILAILFEIYQDLNFLFDTNLFFTLA
jgi:hypothetical protein